MTAYLIKRLGLIIPTLLGILLINFAIVQIAPGGPVELMIAKIKGFDTDATSRFGGSGEFGDNNAGMDYHSMDFDSKYVGARGIDPELIKQIEKMYGFDKPVHERLWLMMKSYAKLDLGESYYQNTKVIDLIKEKLPVSISLGLWSTLLIYLISIPLGIRKAVRDGSEFDIWTSGVIIIGYAIPGFLFAILLIVLFAGGSYYTIFPLRGLTSDGWESMSMFSKIGDYFWHITLPVLSLVISGFAALTLLTKNSFIEEINKQYVITARAKGLSEKRVLYGHVFRNAMLIIISGVPAAFIGILFTGALLVEVIFSLDGLGLLGFEAAVGRDYPVMFGALLIFTLVNLVTHLMGDLTYAMVDPRIDFDKRQG